MGVTFIHPKAHVENSDIGEGTKVWQFASVIRGAKVGTNCTVASGALIDGSVIGDRCIVSQNVAMGPGFIIGNDVFIGPNVVFCNDMWPRVDKNGFHIDGIVIEIKDGASIGANATILPGVTIGRYSMVAAGVVVEANVPDNSLYGRSGFTSTIKPDWREKRMKYV